jgi:hypothetical protein
VRALPPGLYKRAAHPLLLRRAKPDQRRWLEGGEVFFPYFASKVRFDVSAARAALEPVDIRVPRVDVYLDRLLEFAVRANWGRRPVGRAEAGAGVRAVVASAA